jgi:hypothetical protein
MTKKVFLGGTCSDSLWREEIKPLLKIDYFDPVCDGEWTQEAYLRELHERETSDFVMYVVTPKMGGVYSIAEVIDDSNKRPEKTLFCYLPIDDGDVFTKAELKSLKAVAKMVMKNGGKVFGNLIEIVDYLNTFADSASEPHVEQEMLEA